MNNKYRVGRVRGNSFYAPFLTNARYSLNIAFDPPLSLRGGGDICITTQLKFFNFFLI